MENDEKRYQFIGKMADNNIRDEISRFVRIVMKVKWRMISTFYCVVRLWLRKGWGWRG